MPLLPNVRYSIRTLTRSPGFSAVVVLTIGLAIGANVAIYSVVDAVLLDPLPYEDPDRLMLVYGQEKGLKSGSSWNSYPDFVDFEERNGVFTELAGWSLAEVTITGDDLEPLRLPAGRVTFDLFDTLGVQPALGRGIRSEEDRTGGHPVVVLGDGVWNDRYGRDRDVLGRTMVIDGVAHDIVGVMARGFQWADGELWIALGPAHAEDSRGAHRMLALGRLKNDVTPRQAAAEMNRIAAELQREYPDSNTNRAAVVQPLYEAVVGNVRPTLVTLFGAVGFVLLIACANVAGLFVARIGERRREFGIRKAVGAGRGAIVRLYLTESLLLSLAGGAVGVIVATWGMELILSAAPATIPRIAQVGLNLRVLGFALAATLGSGLLFGLAPALQGWREDLLGSLREGGGGRMGGGRRPWLRQILVAAEVALAFVVVIGASLLVNSYVRLQRVDTGYSEGRVLTASLSLPEATYPDWPQSTAFYAKLVEELRRIPGVQSAAAAYRHPHDGGWETSFSIPGVIDLPPGQKPEARIRPVTPGYFRTVGIPLIAGRDFTDRDDGNAPGAVIINESFARRFFPGGDALGHRIERGRWWDELPDSYEIVGVVGDVKMDGMSSGTPWAMYYPHRQVPFNDMFLFVRTADDAPLTAAALRQAVHALDRHLPVESPRTLEQIRSGSVAAERFRVTLLGLFAVTALLLAAVGIYGLLSNSVVQRRGEIGVRMALGARSDNVMRFILVQGLRLTLSGLAAGLLGALGVTRVLSSLLFGVSATDPATFVAVALLFLAVAMAACLIPAARAVRIDPMVVLKAE